MEQERLDKLFFGSRYMEADLLTALEKFRKYIENDTPVVSVLCTDQRLLSQMDKLTLESGNVNYFVCGTFNDTEDALEKAFWSDAVIVDTLALKIAPEGLYKVMKELSVLNKDVYFILSGWEALPKTPEVRQSKLERVGNEFEFLRIKACKNVFMKESDGFSFVEDVLKEYTDVISANFTFTHNAQIEAIYKTLRSKVRAFRESVCNEIQRERDQILQFQSTLRAKQGMHAITITHASVVVDEALERLEGKLKGFHREDVLYSLETEMDSAKENYFENPQAAEKQVKLYVCRRIMKEIDRYLEEANGGDAVSSETSIQISRIMNDLTSMIAVLKKCKFITGDNIKAVEEAIRQNDKLVGCAENYNNSVNLILEQVKEMLEPKVMAFQYEEFNAGVIKPMLGKLKSIAREVKEQKNEASNAQDVSKEQEKIDCKPEEEFELDEYEYEEQMEEDAVEREKWEFFCEETQRMLDYAKNTFSSLLRDNSRTATAEVNIQSQNTVGEYFDSVLTQMDVISQGLSKLLNEYGRNDI